MNQAKRRQPARGQRMSPGYSIPLDICNTLYLQGENKQSKISLKGNKLKHNASYPNVFKQVKGEDLFVCGLFTFFGGELTWSTPHWGWRSSCCPPQSCWSACSGFPQRWQTDRSWSSGQRCCFCPGGCRSLSEQRANTRQLRAWLLLHRDQLCFSTIHHHALGIISFYIKKKILVYRFCRLYAENSDRYNFPNESKNNLSCFSINNY